MAGELRKSMTPAEKVLWERLRNRQVNGYRFRRQHPIKDFIVIEVDGSVHEETSQKERDEQRTIIFKGFGIREIRFTNKEVMNQIDQVIKKIETELEK